MRRLQCALLAAVAAIGFASIASAADMPVKARPMAPAVYDWTGFYIGGHVGAGWGLNSDASYVQPAHVDLDDVFFSRQSKAALLGGAQIGYNWQFAPTCLLGAEVDFSWTDIKNDRFLGALTFNGVPVLAGNTVAMHENLRWLASARARLGYVSGPWLLFATGGAAWANIHYTSLQTYAAAGPSQTDFTKTSSGWVAGGGIEYAWTPHWLLRAEYLHYGLNSSASQTVVCTACAPVTSVHSWGNATVDVIRAAVSYKF